jgi:DNA end-binding protein Ku
MARIEARIKAGETHMITTESKDAAEPRRGAEVIDLVSLLRRSLDKKGKGADPVSDNETISEQPRRAAARKSPARLSKKAAPQRKRA